MACQELRRVGVLSFEKCQRILDGRSFKKIAHNTLLRVDYASGAIAVVHHQTAIITYHANGRIIVDCKGYRSRTTKERIQSLTGINLYQKDFQWFIGDYPYRDGLDISKPFDTADAIRRDASKGDPVAMAALHDMREEGLTV